MKSRIKECRKAAGMSQAELESSVGLDGSTIAKYELGIRKPDLAKWEWLADALHVSPDYLVGWSSKPLCRSLERIAREREDKTYFYHVRSQHLPINTVIIAESPQQAVSVALRHCYDYLPKETEETFKKELMAEEVQTADDSWPRNSVFTKLISRFRAF